MTQAIKALHAGQLHNHLTRENPRTLQELYEILKKNQQVRGATLPKARAAEEGSKREQCLKAC
jgi:hypothetical protein